MTWLFVLLAGFRTTSGQPPVSLVSEIAEKKSDNPIQALRGTETIDCPNAWV